MKRLISCLSAGILLWFGAFSWGHTAETAQGQHSHVRLSQDSQNPQKIILTITLDEGWKTYYKEIGDVGIEPVINFQGSENIKFKEIIWPEPENLSEEGIAFKGYSKKVSLDILFHKLHEENPSLINIDFKYGICNNICLLENIRIDKNIK